MPSIPLPDVNIVQLSAYEVKEIPSGGLEEFRDVEVKQKRGEDTTLLNPQFISSQFGVLTSKQYG